MRSKGYGSWVGLSVCPCVRVSVCLLNISPLERLFVLKTMSCTQRATKVKTIVWISLKLLLCRDTPLPALYGYTRSAILYARIKRMR